MKKVLALGLFLVMLGGCLGKPGPVEEYLKVSGTSECKGANSQGKTLTVVGVRQFKSTDALDRQAVMLARGRVSNPSLRWYWEATPGRMFEQSVAGALNCTSSLAAAWPMRSTTETAYTLTGTVSAFEVQEQTLVLSVSINCQVWDGKGVYLLASREFTREQQIKNMDGQSVAEAAANAISGISNEVGGWMQSVASDERQVRQR